MAARSTVATSLSAWVCLWICSSLWKLVVAMCRRHSLNFATRSHGSLASISASWFHNRIRWPTWLDASAALIIKAMHVLQAKYKEDKQCYWWRIITIPVLGYYSGSQASNAGSCQHKQKAMLDKDKIVYCSYGLKLLLWKCWLWRKPPWDNASRRLHCQQGITTLIQVLSLPKHSRLGGSV